LDSFLAPKQSPNIECYAFEPVSENQKLLEQNIKLNKAEPQIKVVKRAVSNKSGTAVIHLSDKQSGTHSLSVDRGGSSREIQTVSVDEYCKKHKIVPDVIKIDVEGHEASVFDGMTNCLKTNPTIFMEYIPELNKDMKELIKDLGKYLYLLLRC